MRRFGGLPALERGQPVAIVLVPTAGLALAWHGGSQSVSTAAPAAVVGELADRDPRWTWWSAKTTATPLVAAGAQLRTCWDLGAVGRLLHGLRRDDPESVWAAENDLAPPAQQRATLDLFDIDELDAGPIRADGALSRDWVFGQSTIDLTSAQRWAELAIDLQRRQAGRLAELPDPRADRQLPTLALLTAHAESAAALLAVEMEHDGLPLDREVATSLLRDIIGDRPTTALDETARRQDRDNEVRRHFADADAVDLRSPSARCATYWHGLGSICPTLDPGDSSHTPRRCPQSLHCWHGAKPTGCRRRTAGGGWTAMSGRIAGCAGRGVLRTAVPGA